MSASGVVGTFLCNCCCGARAEYTDNDVELGYMRCTGCNCTRARMGSATEIVLRIQIAGVPTIASMEKAAELARLLGAPDDSSMVSESKTLHYLEVSGQGATNALEITRLRKSGHGR